MENSEAEYVLRAMLGQKDAFGVLVDRHRDVVFSICFGRCGNFTDAQDLAQEAFIRAYANLHQLRETDKFAAWLYRITYAVCSQWFRDHKHPALSLDDAIQLPIRSGSVEDELFRHETKYIVADVLAMLPETQRLATTLHYFCGYSYDEIAQITGTSAAIIRNRLQRARGQLRNLLFNRLFEDVHIQRPGQVLTRKVLSGVSLFEKDDTFSHMRALKAVLDFQGQKVDWDYLLGASGEAFCNYFSPQWTYLTRFAHSWDVVNAACEVYGYFAEWRIGGGFEETIDIIESSLSDGKPVAAPGINPSVSEHGGSETHYWFVVTGLDRHKKQICLSGAAEQDLLVSYPWEMRNGQRVYEWHGIVPCLNVWPQLIARNPLVMVAPSANGNPSNRAGESLKRAVALAHEPPLSMTDAEPMHINSGVAAFESWATALRETVAMDLTHCDTPTQTRGHYGSVMYAASKRVEISRHAAASYVHGLAETCPDLPSRDLVEAANHYERVAHGARRLFELYFDPQEELEMRKVVSTQPKPSYYTCDELRRFWNTFAQRFYQDPPMREQGAKIIEQILDEERSAIRCLERAVAEWAVA
jgi:RNA polymerase sigma-70 factor (ECF subfamily)